MKNFVPWDRRLEYSEWMAKLAVIYKVCSLVISLCAAVALCGCGTTSRLAGSVHAANYRSAEGGFSVPFPLSPEVGGRILKDSPQGVTFVDNWGSRITISGLSIAPGSSITSVMATAGREKALTDFAQRQYSDLITVHYHPEKRDGMISFIYLRPASPKTAVAIFIQGSHLYLVETDMLPGVQLLAQGDETSQHDRETWLEGRAVALAQSIEPRE
jgi:hypothetical protein